MAVVGSYKPWGRKELKLQIAKVANDVSAACVDFASTKPVVSRTLAGVWCAVASWNRGHDASTMGRRPMSRDRQDGFRGKGFASMRSALSGEDPGVQARVQVSHQKPQIRN